MKSIKIIVFLILLITCSGCSDANSQSEYIKNIFFTTGDNCFEISYQYYDFYSEEENFLVRKVSGDNLEKLAISTLKDNFQNFRLCENVYISRDIMANNLNLVFFIINSLKIPVSTNIICLLGDTIPENDSKNSTKLYNFSSENGSISGSMEIMDLSSEYNGGIIVSDGKPVKYLEENQWKILNLLTGDSHSIAIKFRDGLMYAQLENCVVYYCCENGLDIQITASLKEYNGISDSIKYEDMFIDLLEKEIENTVYDLYSDALVVSECNLYWYNRNNAGRDTINVKVRIL